MRDFPVKVFCYELILAFYEEGDSVTIFKQPPSIQDSAALLIKLLLQVEDINSLRLKRMTKNSVPGLFS